MKHYLIAGAVAVAGMALMTSCSTANKPLYSWENYESVSYNYSKDQTEENMLKLQKCYDKMSEKQKGLRKVVPPGLCTERAYLLVRQGKKDAAIVMLGKEMELYPESKPFVEKIIKQLQK